MTDTFSVAELLGRVEHAISTTIAGPVWVRGEVSGFNRTKMGAAYLRLVDTDSADHVLEVSARGRVMADIDRALERAGVGSLRSGIQVRVRGTVGLTTRRSQVSLSLLEVDPTFIAGRLAIDREEVLRKLTADGSLAANKRHSLPLVPLRVGLVASRGTAAHADFMHQLRRSGYGFRVKTVQAAMQGERAPAEVVRAIGRVTSKDIDIVALVRGGGSKLDLMAFDTEEVARAVAAAPVPVVSGIGHETDRTIVDEAVAVSEKTPSAAGEWLVSRVADYAMRVETARASIRDRAVESTRRSSASLGTLAASIGSTRTTLARQRDHLEVVAASIAGSARSGILRNQAEISAMEDVISAVGVDRTLSRGFALVSRADGSPVIRAAGLEPGEKVGVRFADGTVSVRVEEQE